MVEMTTTIQNAQGIHCRPSAVIVKYVADYDGGITVNGEKGATALRSILELMTLELFLGSQVTVRVNGPDEETFCKDVVALFETHFDFPPRCETDR
jgi:phosphotransferase system HPr (HPr) family protein|tara:strand:- start:140 stop:427 length:288 start_codon:yes stop_codon:yes gene_type:complete